MRKRTQGILILILTYAWMYRIAAMLGGTKAMWAVVLVTCAFNVGVTLIGFILYAIKLICEDS